MMTEAKVMQAIAASNRKEEAARAMLAALKAIERLPTAAVDCVRGGIDLPALIAQADAAGITEEA